MLLAPVPTPVGAGAAYHPRPAVHAPCRPAPLVAGRRVHLELFANRRVVVVPAAVGVVRPRRALGRVVSARCRARLWTLEPTGVVRFVGGARLGDLFAVWGRRLSARRLLGFAGRVHVYRNGRAWRGDPRRLVLRGGDELVLEVGGFVPPHARFAFPPH